MVGTRCQATVFKDKLYSKMPGLSLVFRLLRMKMCIFLVERLTLCSNNDTQKSNRMWLATQGFELLAPVPTSDYSTKGSRKTVAIGNHVKIYLQLIRIYSNYSDISLVKCFNGCENGQMAVLLVLESPLFWLVNFTQATGELCRIVPRNFHV